MLGRIDQIGVHRVVLKTQRGEDNNVHTGIPRPRHRRMVLIPVHDDIGTQHRRVERRRRTGAIERRRQGGDSTLGRISQCSLKHRCAYAVRASTLIVAGLFENSSTPAPARAGAFQFGQAGDGAFDGGPGHG
jgi:hypothetical protein